MGNSPESFNILHFIGTALILILMIAVVYLSYKLLNSQKHKDKTESKFKQYENRINLLQLENLESRLNPHLFKNILNSIQSHAYQTYFALDKLANVLDYILYESRKKMVTPREEIEFAFNLIEINRIKISPLFELNVKTKINDDEPMLNQKIMAPLTTIDLIENAFKHADLQSPDAFISIIFEFKNNQFLLTVSNKISSRPSMDKEHSGIGQESFDQRLNIIYGNNYKLERFTENDIYIAQLKINLLEHKAKMLAAG